MSFDYNINNYTKEDLMDIFELPLNYDINIINIKEAKLRDTIIKNQQISEEKKRSTLNFLLHAKNTLLNEAQNLQKTPFSGLETEVKSIEDKMNSLYHFDNKLVPTELEGNDEHMIQNKKASPYLSVSQSNYKQGVMNPLTNKNTIIKNLNIDTRFRENYYTTTASNFNFQIPASFNNVVKMRLNAIELPPFFYTVSNQYNNNFFTITVNDVSALVSIPTGSYSFSSIVMSINNSLINLGGNFKFIQFIADLSSVSPYDLNILTGSAKTVVNINTDYVGYEVVTSFSLNFQADKNGLDDRNTSLPLKLGWILGFRNGIYENNLNYVSEGCIDVLTPKYLFLVVDDHNNNVNNGFYSAFNSSILNNNILARISFNTTSTNGTGIFPVKPTDGLNVLTSEREYFGPVNIHNFNIQLVDQYGRIVDLNNMDFSFCLTLTTVYDV